MGVKRVDKRVGRGGQKGVSEGVLKGRQEGVLKGGQEGVLEGGQEGVERAGKATGGYKGVSMGEIEGALYCVNMSIRCMNICVNDCVSSPPTFHRISLCKKRYREYTRYSYTFHP